MKFLLISEAIIDIEQYLKMYLGDYIDNESDVIIKQTVSNAKIFVERSLIENQKHIDFIIADFYSDHFYQKYIYLAQWLRESNYTYSNKNFKLSALPLFIMNNLLGHKRQHDKHEDVLIDKVFDGLLYKPNDNTRIGVTNNPLANGIDN